MSLPKSIKTTKVVAKEINVINHKEVSYKNNKYIVCYIPFNNDDKLFVIDESRKEDIINKKWAFKKESGYISRSITNEEKRSELYLHNFVMNNIDQTLLIDHINDHGCDNRLENLQILNKHEYNNNIKRHFNLPTDCGIKVEDIPKFIAYRKGNTSHGDIFIIDIKLSSGDIKWHSTSSKSMDTKTKLNQTIEKLNEFNKINPELIKLNKKINNNNKQNELKKSYNEILLLSNYPIEIINKNLILLENEIKIDPKIEVKYNDPKIEVDNTFQINSEINDTVYLNEIKKIKPIKVNEINIALPQEKATNISRSRNKLFHCNVEYNNKKYTVGCCNGLNKENTLFVFDYEETNFIIKNKWYLSKKNKYIYTSFINDGVVKYLYQHIYVMDGLVFDQDNALSIDHINQIGRDNRLENLRKLTQSHQNINRRKLKRKVELPEGCGINPQDIPTNIYYRKPEGLHGERFYIDIKFSEFPFTWYSTSSKSIDLQTKLQHAILRLKQFKKENPQYSNLLDDLTDVDNRNDLRKSFNEIIKLSGFPQEVIEQNLVPVEHEKEVIEDQEAQDLATQLIEQGYKNVTSSLPLNCGITPDMIPKYCYYKPAKDKRGDKFIIERHPKLTEKGIRQWATTESKTKTIKEKFDLLMDKLNDLEK